MIEQAKWVTAGKNIFSPCIQREIFLKDFKSAQLEITGLGYFTCEINKKSVSKDRFMPVFSDYKERNFSNLLYPCKDKGFTHTVYYLSFDVSNLLQEGDNLIEVYLGKGYYAKSKRTVEGDLSFGDSLITRYALKVVQKDDTVTVFYSNGQEFWRKTQVIENDIFYGEIQDVRVLQQKGLLKPVKIHPDFNTNLVLQDCPSDSVIETVIPEKIYADGNRTVYDVKEVLTGYARFTATSISGDSVTIRYSGNLNEDFTLNTDTTGAWMKNDKNELQVQKDVFILDGQKREYVPKFCKHCFRYFEVVGNVDDITVDKVHSNCSVTATFNSSNQTLNWIFDAYVRTQLNDMQDGMVLDCPHRERLGYTGDGQATALANMLITDSKKLYEKWLKDIADCQNKQDGHVQYTAPFMGGAGGPGGWGGAIVLIPYALYKRFNDKSVIDKYFANMKLFVNYMESHCVSGLVSYAEDGGYCLGDWGFPEGKKIPEDFVNTFFLVLCLGRMQEMAKAIGNFADEKIFIEKREFYKKAIVEKYYDKVTHSFCSGEQGADAFALEIGLGDKVTAENLAEKYSKKQYYDTGIFGTYYLTKVLFDYGYYDVAYKLLTCDKKPSFGYLKNNGATTLYENLLMTGSDCHHMFGSVVELFFTRILGFAVSNGKTYEIKPCLPSVLDFVEGSILVDGKIVKGKYSREKNSVIFDIDVPKEFNAKLVYLGKEFPLRSGKNVIKV